MGEYTTSPLSTKLLKHILKNIFLLNTKFLQSLIKEVNSKLIYFLPYINQYIKKVFLFNDIFNEKIEYEILHMNYGLCLDSIEHLGINFCYEVKDYLIDQILTNIKVLVESTKTITLDCENESMLDLVELCFKCLTKYLSVGNAILDS